jgi:hypothetical protein
MGKYQYDMSGEKEPNKLFDEGWHELEVVSLEEQTSKQGNTMFKIEFVKADDPSAGLTAYAVAEKGKRWFLKALLKACGLEAGEDGTYDWDIEDVEGKTVSARIENVNEAWIDRNGESRTTPKSKIAEFKKIST